MRTLLALLIITLAQLLDYASRGALTEN